MRFFRGVSSRDAKSVSIELVNLIGTRREIDCVTVVHVDVAACPYRDGFSKAVDFDVEECIAAEVFRDTNNALPIAALAGNSKVLWSNTDGLRVVLGRFRTFDQVHLRRPDKACDELVLRGVIEI